MEKEATEIAIPERLILPRAEDFSLLPPLTRLAEEFTRGIKEGMKVAPSFYDGMRHQEIIDAILLSQRERRWVTLALEGTRHL